MNGSRRASLPAALALLPLLAAAQVGGPPPREARYDLEVTVTDTSGAAVEGAEVTCSFEATLESSHPFRPGIEKRTGTTNYNGRLTLPVSSDGYWRVEVKREGYVDAEDRLRMAHFETVRIDRARTIRLAVQLLKAAALEGTVYLEDGRRVNRAVVRLQPAGFADGPERRAGASWLVQRTDDTGRYRFPVVPPGDYGMWISPPEAVARTSLRQSSNGGWIGYAGTLWHPSVEEVRNIVPVTLDPGQDLRGVDPVLRKVKVLPLKGVLYDQLTGRPLTRASVGLRASGPAPIEVYSPRPVNALSGGFEFPPLPEDNYDLMVYRDEPGMDLPLPVHFHLGGAGVQSAGLFVPPSSAGEPVEGRWTALGHRRESGLGVVVPGWEAWRGRLVALPASDLAFARMADRFGAGRTEVRLYPLELPEFGFVIAALDDRNPARLDSGPGRSYALQTPLLPPGPYRLEVETPEGWFTAAITNGGLDLAKREDAASGLIVTPASSSVEITIKRGGAGLEGSVVNGKGEPAPNSSVCAVSSDAWRIAQPGGAFCVRADADAKYRSRWLAPGQWRLWAFAKKPPERPGSADFEKKYGSSARALDVPDNCQTLKLTLLASQ